MTAIDRPRRSALYMPASNLRALEKAKALQADMLIFDLEDAEAGQLGGRWDEAQGRCWAMVWVPALQMVVQENTSMDEQTAEEKEVGTGTGGRSEGGP